MLVNHFLFSKHYQDDVHFFINMGLMTKHDLVKWIHFSVLLSS